MATRAELLRPGLRGGGAISPFDCITGAGFGVADAFAPEGAKGRAAACTLAVTATVADFGLAGAALGAAADLLEGMAFAFEGVGAAAAFLAGVFAGEDFDATLAAGFFAAFTAGFGAGLPGFLATGLTGFLTGALAGGLATGFGLEAVLTALLADLGAGLALAAGLAVTLGFALAGVLVFLAGAFTMCLLSKTAGQGHRCSCGGFPASLLWRSPALSDARFPGWSADCLLNRTPKPPCGSFLACSLPAGLPIRLFGYCGRRAIVAADQPGVTRRYQTVGESRQT